MAKNDSASAGSPPAIPSGRGKSLAQTPEAEQARRMREWADKNRPSSNEHEALWGGKEVCGALLESPKARGAPPGWGVAWSLQAAAAAKNIALGQGDSRMWEELVWALGVGQWADRLRWDAATGNLGKVVNESFLRQMSKTPLIVEWAQRAGSELETQEPGLDECRRMVSVWTQAGGSLRASSWRRGERRQVAHAESDTPTTLLAATVTRSGAGSHRAIALLEAGAPADEESDGCEARFLEWAAAEPRAADAMALALSLGARLPAQDDGAALLSAIRHRNGRAAALLAKAMSTEAGGADGGAQAFRRGWLRVEKGLDAESQGWMAKIGAQEEAEELKTASNIGPASSAAARGKRL